MRISSSHPLDRLFAICSCTYFLLWRENKDLNPAMPVENAETRSLRDDIAKYYCDSVGEPNLIDDDQHRLDSMLLYVYSVENFLKRTSCSFSCGKGGRIYD